MPAKFMWVIVCKHIFKRLISKQSDNTDSRCFIRVLSIRESDGITEFNLLALFIKKS